MNECVDKMNRAVQIIFIQCAVALLIWSVLWNVPLFRTHPSKQIAQISDDSLAQLSKSIVFYKKTRQLKKEDETILEDKIQKLAQALEWKQERFQLYPRLPIDGVIPVDLRLDFIVEPQSIPIFLAGVKRLPYGGVLDKLEYAKEERRLSIQLRFLRAQPQPPTWLQEDTDLTEKERSIMLQGFMLMFWRGLYVKQQERENTDSLSKSIFLLEVSRRLAEETNINWSRKGKFKDKSF